MNKKPVSDFANATFDIYARKSVYREESESIENQVKMCKEYIFSKFPGAVQENIFVYEDDGFSGKDTNRPQFRQMITDLKRRKINYFVCYKIDRVARSIVDFANFVQKLESKKVEFICVKDNIDTSSYMGRAMMYIVAIFAEIERRQIADRVRDGMLHIATKGRNLGIPPLGFDTYEEKAVDSDGNLKSSHYLKPNKKIEIVKTIFQKFLEFGSTQVIADYLLEIGERTIGGKYFSITAIARLLQTPTYCTADKYSFEYFKNKGANVYFGKSDFNKGLGIVGYNLERDKPEKDASKWVISIGKHPGTISGKDWVTVQKIFASRVKKPRMPSKSTLLSGLIKCQWCGSTMQLKHKTKLTKKENFYYACATKLVTKRVKCNIKNVNGPKAEKFITDFLMNLDEKKLKACLNIRKYSRKVNKFDDELYDIKYTIDDINRKKQNLLKHLDENDAPHFFNEIKNRIIGYNKQIEELKAKKHVCESAFNLATREKADVEQILKNIKKFKKNFNNADFVHKKALLNLVVDKLIWSGTEFKIFLNGLGEVNF